MRWIVVLTMWMVACYSPQPATGVACGLGGACPDGLVCSAATQTCELRDLDAAVALDSAAIRDAHRVTVDATPPDASVPRWSLIQTAASATATTSMASTGQGHLIVVAMETTNATSISAVTDNAATGTNTYVAIPMAHSSNGADGFGLEIWFVTNSYAGATTVSVTAAGLAATVVWEVSGIRTDASSLDVATALDDEPATLTPQGPTITTTAAGEFVVAATIVANTITEIHTGNEFTNDHRTNGNGWAHLTSNTSAPGSHQAEWDQDIAGVGCASAAAFQVAP